MNKIFISETSGNKNNLYYLYNNLNQSLIDCQAKADLDIDDKRVNVTYCVESKFCDFFTLKLEESISDIIAISYKYSFLKDNIKTSGLNAFEYECLLASLIAADFDDDVKFIKNKLKSIDVYTIDGFFNFRLNALKNKWGEIASYIPPFFTANQLKDFIIFLISESGKEKKVYLDNDIVYDRNFNKLDKRKLINCEKIKENVVIELILSGCNKVEIKGSLDKNTEKFLKDYYNGRTEFSKNFFS